MDVYRFLWVDDACPEGLQSTDSVEKSTSNSTAEKYAPEIEI